MKKFISFLLALVLFWSTIICASAQSDSFSVRNGIQFGILRDDVVKAEGSEPDAENESGFVYRNISISGLSADLFFFFKDKLLNSVIYDFKDNVNSFHASYLNYSELKEALTEKYGDPTADEHELIGSKYGSGADDFISAFSAGDVKYLVGWELENVTIIMTLDKDGSSYTLRIGYSAPEEEKERQPITGDDL